MMEAKEDRKSDISALGVDLLVEILCRLGSVKYATQCKSVCKRWCSLINPNPLWLHRWCQMNRKEESATLLIETDDRYKGTPTSCVDLNFLPCFNGRDQVYVLCSHKDLLLCCPHYYDRCSFYYICNPLTKQWIVLPPPPPTKSEVIFINKYTQVEFIVDGGSKFTVVRIIPNHIRYFSGSYEDAVQVSIFSSDLGWTETGADGEWREMFPAQRLCKKIVSYKGALVWLMWKELADEVRVYRFDLHSNYTRLPLITLVYLANPEYAFRHMCTIGLCEGRLRIARMFESYKKLIVWQLDDDSKKHDWDIVQEFDFTAISWYKHEERLTITTQDMTFDPHDGDILYMSVGMTCHPKDSSYIFMCNLKTKKLELMRKLPKYWWSSKIFPLVMQCWPTPVLPLQP